MQIIREAVFGTSFVIDKEILFFSYGKNNTC